MRTLAANLAFLAASSLSAEPVLQACKETSVVVSAESPKSIDLACEAVQQAATLFARCNVPAIENPLRIDVVESVPEGCVALYHCGEDWIEILTLERMRELRSDESAFDFLTVEDYFRSVVVHEMAHAAFDRVPCPYPSCVVANEYVAYAMQVMSLAPDAQREFEENSGLEGHLERDELNAVILFMAPDVFARKAWKHLSQHDNRCGFIDQITSGAVILDSPLL